MRCLIVDDLATPRIHLKALLRQAAPEAEVVDVDDATLALQEFRKRPFDLVFLDLRMGGENGVDILRRLRALDPGARVVVVTGLRFSDPDVQEALAAGTFDALPKPVSLANLRRVLDSAAAASA